MQVKEYIVIFRYDANHEWIRRRVLAVNEEQAKLAIKYEEEVTHNQIEFKSINLNKNETK